MELRHPGRGSDSSEYDGSLRLSAIEREERFSDVEERTAVFRSWEMLELVFFVCFGVGARGAYRAVRGWVSERVFLRVACVWSAVCVILAMISVYSYHAHWLHLKTEGTSAVKLLMFANFVSGIIVAIILPYSLIVVAIDDLPAAFRPLPKVDEPQEQVFGRTETESEGRVPQFREHWRPLLLSVALSSRDGVRSSLPPSMRTGPMMAAWATPASSRQQCASSTPAITAVVMFVVATVLFYLYRWVCWTKEEACMLPSGFLGFLSVYGLLYWNAIYGYTLVSILIAARFTTSLCEFVAWQAEGTGGSLQSVRHDLTRFMRLMDIVGETISLLRRRCGLLLNLIILSHFLDLTLSTLAHIYTDAVDVNNANAPTGNARDHSASTLPSWGVFVAVLWDAVAIFLLLRSLSMPGDVSATFSKALVRRLVAESESAWDEALRSHGILWWAHRHERRLRRRQKREERERKDRRNHHLPSLDLEDGDGDGDEDDVASSPPSPAVPPSPIIPPPPEDARPVGLEASGVIPDALVLTTAVKYTTFLFGARLTIDFFGVSLTSEATLGFANVLIVALIVWCTLVQGAPSITSLLNLASGSAAAGSFFSLFLLLIIAAALVSLILSSTSHVHIFPRALRRNKPTPPR